MANSPDIADALVTAGLPATAARIIANALANLNTPQRGIGQSFADATPTENLRLITKEDRLYQFTNLDHPSDSPFRQAVQDSPGSFDPAGPDHPYTDAQPLSPNPTLTRPIVVQGDYITVESNIAESSSQSVVSLRTTLDTGVHLRFNKGLKAIEGVALSVSNASGQYLVGSFQETRQGTELELALRRLKTVNVMLADGNTLNVVAFDTNPDSTAAAGPFVFTATGATLNRTNFTVDAISSGNASIEALTDSSGLYSELRLNNTHPDGDDWRLRSYNANDGLATAGGQLVLYNASTARVTRIFGPNGGATSRSTIPNPASSVLLPQYVCRAFARFRGGNPTLSSPSNTFGVIFQANCTVTKLGTGNYRLTFTTPMPDITYIVLPICTIATNVTANVQAFPYGAISLTSADIICLDAGSAARDPDEVHVAVFA